MWYEIHYLYLTEKTDCAASPLFMHLPCSFLSTQDEKLALEWFDAAVKSAVKTWNGSELVYVKDCKLDYQCRIKVAKFICKESAYLKGEYLIELRAFNHNPCE